jgi:cell division protein FtsI (penicillin-binding protein 3)
MNKTIKTRILMVAFLLSAALLAILLNFFNLQVMQHQKYSEQAERQYHSRRTIPAQRGTIFDRDGDVLAFNRTSYHFDLYKPELGKDRQRLLKLLGRIGENPPRYYERIIDKNDGYVQIIRALDEDKARQLIAADIKALRFSKTFSRYYPLTSTGSQVLGFCGTDGKGLEGIENALNEALAGQQGERFVFADARRRGLVRTDLPFTRAIDGRKIILTMRIPLQTVLEQELKRALRKSQAYQAQGVIVDIHTGDVVAMSSLPDYDPNNIKGVTAKRLRNRCITDIFEPGSILKAFAAAAVLQEKKSHPEEVVFCENGKLKIYNKTIRDHKAYGDLSFNDIIRYSSNIGIIKLSRRLDRNAFFAYLRDFGFGEKTGILLPGEAAGVLEMPDKWSGLSQASISIGHEIGVTPLQVALAYAAIANGGTLYKPNIIYQLEGNPVRQPLALRRVVSEPVTQILRKMLIDAVENGTGQKARLAKIKIAGKTGTAQKYNHKDGAYSKSDYVSSFAGFFPADKPQYAMVIVIDTPKGEYYGGEIAAPVFRDIVYHIMGLPYEDNPIFSMADVVSEDSAIFIPDLTGIAMSQARKILKNYQLPFEVQGDAGIVVEQYPVKGARVGRNTLNKILLVGNYDYGKSTNLKQLKGLQMKEAVHYLRVNGIDVEMQGFGRIIDQQPKAGTPIRNIRSVVLKGDKS